jgi:pimeloyl-ACP methyl ester carboxylesterase
VPDSPPTPATAPTPAPSPAGEAVRRDVSSPDGTRLATWTFGDRDGVPVVLSNGLGAPWRAWPGFAEPGSGVRVTTWDHRGCGGSERPRDPAWIRIEHHVEDLFAVMDAFEIDRAPVVGWSLGVNVGFEAALLRPERVSGLLAVAGVPGGTFATMLGPLLVPRGLRHTASTSLARVGRVVGGPLSKVTSRLPVAAPLPWLVTHSGFMLPAAGVELVGPVLRDYLQLDFGWYFRLALAAAEQRVPSPEHLAALDLPVMLLAGRHDLLTAWQDVVAVAERIGNASARVLPGSHFLNLEHPREVTQALRDLLAQTV